MSIFLVAFYILSLVGFVFGNTIQINTEDCFGLAESPISLTGAVVSSAQSLGRVLCFFSPLEIEQYMNILINHLSLPKAFGSCPSIVINEYSSVRDEIIQDDDPNLRVPMSVPADPKLLFSANCTNYATMNKQVRRTSAPGLKLQLIFDPLNSDALDVNFVMTLTAFVLGPSFNCPSGTFRCWDDRSRCIPESLTCDGVDNCLDGSDENNYLCTGRINGIPVPLFAIIIVVAFLCLILLVTAIVFILRKQKAKQKQEEQTWVDMTIRHPNTVQQPLINQEEAGSAKA